MKGRIVVKVGSNVLTRPDGMLDVTRQSAIVDQIAELTKRGLEVVLVSSGAVASGRGELRGMPGTERLDAVEARQLFSAVGQAKLINRYYELFREHNIHCGQVLATKENFADRRSYLNQQGCMNTMLAHKVVPVVNENDTVSLSELMFTDNDELSGLIAGMMNADKLIILSNIDGMYTGNPDDHDSVLIPRIRPDDDPSAFVSAEKSSLGRGGMLSKCRIARLVAAEGIEVIIANGRRENILTALADNADVPHTVFEAAARPASGLKKWIAHSDGFAKGSIHVNQGCAEALTTGASLLPVGVTAVEGAFKTNDIVTIINPEGHTVAWGKATCDSGTAQETAGKPGMPVLVHADYMFLNPERLYSSPKS